MTTTCFAGSPATGSNRDDFAADVRNGSGEELATGRLDSSSVADVTRPEVEAAGRRVRINGSDDHHGYDTSIVVRFHDGTEQSIHSDGAEARWLLTVPEVASALREKFAVSGLDAGIVDELVTTVPGLLGGSDVRPVLDILGRTL